jgi:hypothetical protein
MKVSRAFLDDLALIANKNDWSKQEIEQVKQEIRDEPELRSYYEILAFAYRSGYEQTRENECIRLVEWFFSMGWDNPFNVGLPA